MGGSADSSGDGGGGGNDDGDSAELACGGRGGGVATGVTTGGGGDGEGDGEVTEPPGLLESEEAGPGPGALVWCSSACALMLLGRSGVECALATWCLC